VDFAGPDQGTRLHCEVVFHFGGPSAQVSVRGANGKEVRSIDWPIPVLQQQAPDYAKIASTAESWCDAPFIDLLKAEGHQPKPVTVNESLVTPKEVEALLEQVDPQRAFLAANLLHRAIADSGESPQRLAALVRAYSQLGESTRYLYSRHGSVFFARALIYAERLVRKYPKLPLSHAARGYAYALLGEPTDAQAAFAKARELAGAGESLPAWARMADDLSHFRTRRLFDQVGDTPTTPLASYLALLTVEHSGMDTLVINMSRLALKHNPGALRVINIMSDNSGVSLQHETTAQSAQAQFALLAGLADEQAVPDALRSAASDAAKERLAAPRLLELFAKMDHEPATGGQLLPWSAYASVSRDALFVAGFRRLYFTQHMLGTDVSSRLNMWWPMLKDHRFAAVIAGFDRTGKLGDNEMIARMRQVDLLEIYDRMTWMSPFMKQRQNADHPWLENYEYTSDQTVYDIAHKLWSYRMKEADAVPVLSVIKGAVGKSLEAMCPSHPSAFEQLIVNRWPETRPRAAQIERDMDGNPQVAYALARAYRADKRFDDAARLLESVIEISPDHDVYEELAEMYKQQGNADKWIEIYDKYLATTEDFGLEHARVNEKIAYTLMRMNKLEKALPYAQHAAESYSGWGLNAYAACLTEMGRYDIAEQVQKANQERYPDSFAWYRWCQTTGKGDLNAARAMSMETVPGFESSTDDGELNEAAIVLQLDGQVDRAHAYWERAVQRRHDPYDALQLCMLDLEKGNTQQAQDRLEGLTLQEPQLPPGFEKMMGGVMPKTDDTRLKIYAAAVEEIQRCLADPSATPARNGDVKIILDAIETGYRVNCAYFLGRLCELRGKTEDAKWWYRTSMQTQEWTASCRPQSAAALRRMGEEFYK
jgi:tetratricopeptide (TPR) repeat protein